MLPLSAPALSSPLRRLSRWAPLLALTLSAVMAAPAAASTVGSGRSATETRAVEGFEAVSLEGSIDLEVRQAAQASVAVTADDNLLPQIGRAHV